MKNKLIEAVNEITNVKNYVANLTNDELNSHLAAGVLVEKALNPIFREEKFKRMSGDEKFAISNPTWDVQLSLSLGTTRKEIVEKSIIDKEKAIQFAKEHNFEIPMTKRIIIEPTIDFAKLEDMEWFQENIEQFRTLTKEEKVIKTYNTIRPKIVKK